MSPRVAILRFPGSNCERESLQAIRRSGLEGRIVRWNEPAEELARGFDAYLLPGGFSYQDRIRAGAVAARLPLMEVLTRRAAESAPILGICNGAQILVEAGLVPGGSIPEDAVRWDREKPRPALPVRAALAPNRIPQRNGYYTRWIHLAPGPAAHRCLFTRGLEEPIPMPMAHGEGRFTTAEEALARRFHEEAALCYAHADGRPATTFAWNPNGSVASAAGITNAEGNVLALMPHPERAQILGQVPEHLPGAWGERRRRSRTTDALQGDGPGLFLFQALARHLLGKEVAS